MNIPNRATYIHEQSTPCQLHICRSQHTNYIRIGPVYTITYMNDPRRASYICELARIHHYIYERAPQTPLHICRSQRTSYIHKRHAYIVTYIHSPNHAIYIREQPEPCHLHTYLDTHTPLYIHTCPPGVVTHTTLPPQTLLPIRPHVSDYHI